jgi:hypothetical protein
MDAKAGELVVAQLIWNNLFLLYAVNSPFLGIHRIDTGILS